MTTTHPSDVHFLGPLTIVLAEHEFGAGAVMDYGSELRLTPELVEANTDRNGHCSLLEMLDDEDAQIRRWGRVMVRPGPWPEDKNRTEPGSLKWWSEYEQLRLHAHEVKDEQERARQLALIEQVYGRPVTSQTLQHYRHPQDGGTQS